MSSALSLFWRFIHTVAMYRYFISFHFWVTPGCMHIPWLVYPFPYWWILELFQFLPLRIKLLWTSLEKSFCGHTFSVSWENTNINTAGSKCRCIFRLPVISRTSPKLAVPFYTSLSRAAVAPQFCQHLLYPFLKF